MSRKKRQQSNRKKKHDAKWRRYAATGEHPYLILTRGRDQFVINRIKSKTKGNTSNADETTTALQV